MATALSVVIDVTNIESLRDRILTVDTESIGRAALRSVNIVAERGFTESRKVMLRAVNLSDEYVKDRMELVPANEPSAPTATIIAFRPGGERKPRTRPVNLRQYAPVQVTQAVRWPNSTPQIEKQKWGKNPRASDKWLKWKPRVGTTQKGAFNMPVGQKQAGISVEVLRGQRKTISYAFVASARAGKVDGAQGLLVFKREKDDHKGKGKLVPIYSLSVWQMFRNTTAKVIPLIADDLQRTTADEVVSEIQDKLSTA